jgi:TPR repeat protein
LTEALYFFEDAVGDLKMTGDLDAGGPAFVAGLVNNLKAMLLGKTSATSNPKTRSNLRNGRALSYLGYLHLFGTDMPTGSTYNCLYDLDALSAVEHKMSTWQYSFFGSRFYWWVFGDGSSGDSDEGAVFSSGSRLYRWAFADDSDSSGESEEDAVSAGDDLRFSVSPQRRFPPRLDDLEHLLDEFNGNTNAAGVDDEHTWTDPPVQSLAAQKQALAYFLEADILGSPFAPAGIGLMHDNGWAGLESNWTAAEEFYLKGAKAGDHNGATHLSRMYVFFLPSFLDILL